MNPVKIPQKMNDLTNLLKLEKGYLASPLSELDNITLFRAFSPNISSNRSFKKIAEDLLSLESKRAKPLNETYSKYDGK